MLRYLKSSVNIVGLDESTQRDRSQTVEDHFKVRNGPEEIHLDKCTPSEPAGQDDQGGERVEEEAGGEPRAQHQAVRQTQQGFRNGRRYWD